MKNSDYITILAPMVSKLNLSGNNLIIFALIHGFTKDGKHEFDGSLEYISEWTNLSKNTVIATLKALVENGFLNKKEKVINNVKFCSYTTNYDALVVGGSADSAPLFKKYDKGSADSAPNNDSNNNIKKEERDKSLSKKEKPLWKTNFAEYQKLVEEARAVLKSDNDFRQKMLKFNPNADYDLSIDKSVETFWLTEAGWNNKKKSRENSIDMVATLKRNFDRNIVYLRYGQKARLDNCNQSAINEDKLVINGIEYE